MTDSAHEHDTVVSFHADVANERPTYPLHQCQRTQEGSNSTRSDADNRQPKKQELEVISRCYHSGHFSISFYSSLIERLKHLRLPLRIIQPQYTPYFFQDEIPYHRSNSSAVGGDSLRVSITTHKSTYSSPTVHDSKTKEVEQQRQDTI